jgi:uncharacterized ferredoxin-like protein
MILNERDARHEHVIECAKQMMTAARTAPQRSLWKICGALVVICIKSIFI